MAPVSAPASAAAAHKSSLQQPRGSVRVQSSIEFVESISKEEAAKFDRIAASLIAKLDNVQDFDQGASGARLRYRRRATASWPHERPGAASRTCRAVRAWVGAALPQLTPKPLAPRRALIISVASARHKPGAPRGIRPGYLPPNPSQAQPLETPSLPSLPLFLNSTTRTLHATFADEAEEGEEDSELVPFGASAAQVAARQARLAQLRSSGVTGSSAAAAGAGDGGLSLSDGPDGAYTPRNKRRRKIPDEALPKVGVRRGAAGWRGLSCGVGL